MHIEFLSFAGCPHAPVLRQRLEEALHNLGVGAQPVAVDLEQLSRVLDPRSAYGSPTILVDGIDLFGMDVPSAASAPACRLYRPAFPTTAGLTAKLRERIAGSR